MRQLLLKIVPILLVLGVLGWCGAYVANYKLAAARKVEFVGHSDECAYATMARSLVAGRGLQVDYISWHFLQYDPGITRREDHWPPFMAFAIAPFYYFMGSDQAWVAKIPAILIGSLGLPLLAAALALTLSRRAYVGLVAGLIMMFEPLVFTESMKTLCDVPTAALVTGVCWALLAARRHAWMHVAAGLFVAGAYYAKGSQIILVGLYPAAYLVYVGFRHSWSQRRWLVGGMLTALLLMAPYMIGNYRAYGNPLHSTQNYVSGYIGLLGTDTSLGWEDGTYKIYWDQQRPKTSDRWTKYPAAYWPLVAKNCECFTRWALLGPSTGDTGEAWDDLGWWGWHARAALQNIPLYTKRPVTPVRPVTQWKEPSVAVAGVATMVGVPLLLLATPLAWWWSRKRKASGRPAEVAGSGPAAMRGTEPLAPAFEKPKPMSEPWLIRPILALLLIVAAQWFFVVAFWQWLWMARLALVMVPCILAIGLTLLSRVLETPAALVWGLLGFWGGRGDEGKTPSDRDTARAAWWRTGGLLANAALTLAAVVYLGLYGANWRQERIAAYAATPQAHWYPWVDAESPGYMPTVRMGRYIKEHLPQAIIMNRYPWQLIFYAASTNKAVAVPRDADPERILAVAKYYHCGYIVRDGNRAPLEPYFTGAKPGFKQVPGSPGGPGAPGGQLYEIDWSQFPGLKAIEALGLSKSS
jgi:4-amino-4-deoxy-L-arabinose transferase-like glycosyltransferase